MKNVSLGAGLIGSGWGITEGFLAADKRTDSEGKFIDQDYVDKETDETKKAAKKELLAKKKDFDATDRYIGGTLSVASSLIGGTGNVAQFLVNGKQRKNNKNKRKRAALNFSTAGNVFGLLGNASKLGAGINSLAANPDKDDAAKSAGSWLGALSSGLGLIGSITGLGGSLYTRALHQGLAGDLDEEHIIHDNNDAAETARKRAVEQNQGDKTSQAYKNSLADYKSLKARKYGLEQARRFHEVSGSGYVKGSVGALGSLISSGTSLAKGFFDDLTRTKAGMIATGFASILGTGCSMLEKFISSKSDSHKKEENKVIMLDEIDKYLIKKRTAVDRDVQSKLGNGIRLADNEKDRITLMRLGVDAQIVNADIPEKEKLAAFEALNLKRAKQIMDSRDSADIIKALGLDPDAGVKDIAAALKGE